MHHTSQEISFWWNYVAWLFELEKPIFPAKHLRFPHVLHENVYSILLLVNYIILFPI